MELAALPEELARHLASEGEDGWVRVFADAHRSQVKNRAAALQALEARVIAALRSNSG
jgi:hypothetical protein